MRDLVRYLLQNAQALPRENWTAQGFGFLRLRINDGLRVHVWDSRLRVAGVSDVHDHTQWAFISSVMAGEIVNIRYTLCKLEDPGAEEYRMKTLVCGIGGHISEGPAEQVYLKAGAPELYRRGDQYRQEPDEIHRTMPADGTVTLLAQDRRDANTARVFWPAGGTWGDAIPRQATREEIIEVVTHALSIYG